MASRTPSTSPAAPSSPSAYPRSRSMSSVSSTSSSEESSSGSDQQPGNSLGPRPPTVQPATSRELRFPWKLHLLLERCHGDPAFQDVASWSSDGKSFKIHNKDKFVSKVMPLFFGAGNGDGGGGCSPPSFSSSSASTSATSAADDDVAASGGCATKQWKTFQRNLNLWGFHRVSKGPQKDVVSHPFFVRGYPVLSRKMKRCTFKGVGRGNRAPPPSSTDFTVKEVQNDEIESSSPSTTAAAVAAASAGETSDPQLPRKTSSSSFIMWPNSTPPSSSDLHATNANTNSSYPLPAVDDTAKAVDDVAGMVAKLRAAVQLKQQRQQQQNDLHLLINQLHNGGPASSAAASIFGTTGGLVGSGAFELMPPSTASTTTMTPGLTLAQLSSQSLPQVFQQPMAAQSSQADDLIAVLQQQKRLIEEQREQDLEFVQRYLQQQQESAAAAAAAAARVQTQVQPSAAVDNRALLQIVMAQMHLQEQQRATAMSPLNRI